MDVDFLYNLVDYNGNFKAMRLEVLSCSAEELKTVRCSVSHENMLYMRLNNSVMF